MTGASVSEASRVRVATRLEGALGRRLSVGPGH